MSFGTYVGRKISGAKKGIGLSFINRLLKKSFFLGPLHGLTRAKYYPQACLKQTGLFLKNNKPKPFDGIIREICHPLDSLFVTSI